MDKKRNDKNMELWIVEKPSSNGPKEKHHGIFVVITTLYVV